MSFMTNRKIVIVGIVAVMIVAGLTVWISMTRFSRTLPEPNYTFSGRGSLDNFVITISKISLEKGPAMFNVEIHGNESSVWLLDVIDDKSAVTFINDGLAFIDNKTGMVVYEMNVYPEGEYPNIGDEGSDCKVIDIKKQGDYGLAVWGNCKWTVSITQPVPEQHR